MSLCCPIPVSATSLIARPQVSERSYTGRDQRQSPVVEPAFAHSGASPGALERVVTRLGVPTSQSMTRGRSLKRGGTTTIATDHTARCGI